MDKQRHQAERQSLDDRRRRDDAAMNPQHYYPRPGDVIDDDTLSFDEKVSLLRNWQVQLEDRAGALGQPQGPGAAPGIEDAEMHQAVVDALRQLDALMKDDPRA
jgi:hypothetical protein